MKTLLLALLGAFFIVPAYATDWPDGKVYESFSGTRVTLHTTSTQEAFNFGFQSNAVRICVVANATGTQDLYMRRGITLSATQSSYFISGGGNQAGLAAPLTFGGDGTDTQCEVFPLAVRGLIFHSTGNATVDVTAFR